VEIAVWVVGGIAVFVVAAVAVGRVTHALAVDAERSVYDVDQAIEFVAQALPDDVTARLSYDDVTTILKLFHDHLHARGVATTAGEDERRGDVDVVDPVAGVDHVMLRTKLAGVEYARSDVEAVVAAQLEYFAAIGVIGGPAEGPSEGTEEPGTGPIDRT
jgi:hypothetical protein